MLPKNNVSFPWKPNTVIRWDHDLGMSSYYVILSVVPILPPEGNFQFTLLDEYGKLVVISAYKDYYKTWTIISLPD